MSNLWRMFDFSMKLENLYFIKLTVQKTLLFSNFIFFLKVLKRIYNIYVEIFNSIAWICATMPVAWWWAINWLMPTAAPQIVHASQEELALARKVLQWMKRLVKNSKKTCQKKRDNLTTLTSWVRYVAPLLTKWLTARRMELKKTIAAKR